MANRSREFQPVESEFDNQPFHNAQSRYDAVNSEQKVMRRSSKDIPEHQKRRDSRDKAERKRQRHSTENTGAYKQLENHGGHGGRRPSQSSPGHIAIPSALRVKALHDATGLSETSTETKLKYVDVIHELETRNSGPAGHSGHRLGAEPSAADPDHVKVHIGKNILTRSIATQYAAQDQRPETHYMLGIFSFICCPLFSLLSIRASQKTTWLANQNKITEARSYSSRAHCLGVLAVCFGMILFVVLAYVLTRVVDAAWWQLV